MRVNDDAMNNGCDGEKVQEDYLPQEPYEDVLSEDGGIRKR